MKQQPFSTKNSPLLLAATAALLTTACQTTQQEQPTWAQTPSSTIQYQASNPTLLLTDYFPTLQQPDSIVMASGASVTTLSDDKNSLLLHNVPQGITPLTIWKEGVSATLPIINNQSPITQQLYTTSCQSNKITVGFTQKPDQVLAFWQNQLLPQTAISINNKQIVVKLPKGISHLQRSFIRLYAAAQGSVYNDVLVPLQYGEPIENTQALTRHDKQAQVLYSLMIDRFYNGNSANDRKLNHPEVLDIVDYQGGDLKGITQKIKEGFFQKLGITTIWISPITQNPNDAWGLYPTPRTRFSGYHGYWPIYITKLDDRFGTNAELTEMLDVAHQHNLNVILDYVANHLHINSPVLQQNPDWITDSVTPDGRRNFELWDEFRLTTWFDAHIPSLRLDDPEICDQLTDSALFWVENFDFDGFRHDACKHIPELYWRTLTQKLKTRYPHKELYQIGETYGSPELINSYVKSGMLDAQFDFNVYHTAIDVFGRDDRSMQDLNRVITEGLKTYGAHHTMGNISGNHDKARFISLAGKALSFDEDHKYAGWNRTVTVGDTAIAYRKSLLLEALNLTIPGVPCIYQGDEYGEPGGNDPDNRRMMRFGGYNTQEASHLQQVEELVHLRRTSMPLIYGDYLPLHASKELLCFARVYMGEVVVVALNKSLEKQTISVSLLNGLTLQGKSTIDITLAPLSYQVIR